MKTLLQGVLVVAVTMAILFGVIFAAVYVNIHQFTYYDVSSAKTQAYSQGYKDAMTKATADAETERKAEMAEQQKHDEAYCSSKKPKGFKVGQTVHVNLGDAPDPWGPQKYYTGEFREFVFGARSDDDCYFTARVKMQPRGAQKEPWTFNQEVRYTVPEKGRININW